jgi:iron-sulfur cluster repair protein YtfE (RIC family)
MMVSLYFLGASTQWCFLVKVPAPRCYRSQMEKLNRITLLDNSNRPKAPKIENLSAAQRRQGRRLSLYHNMHREQMRQVMEAIEQIDDTLRTKISELDMRNNFKTFGNMCGEECQMLTFHHQAEDQMMFPALHREGGDGLRKVVARLQAEHLVVHELLDALEAGAEAALRNPAPETYATLRETFKHLDTCVRSHFGYEETELEDALAVIDVGI